MKIKGKILIPVLLAIAVAFAPVVNLDGEEEYLIKTETFSKYKPAADYRVDVQVNIVDLIALDSNGRHVTDLRPDEIKLYHDGDLQKIQKVDKKGKPLPYPGESEAAAAAKNADLESDELPGQNYAFLVANLPEHGSRKRQIIEKVTDFISKNTNKNDKVALYHMGRSEIKQLQPFIKNKLETLANFEKYMDSGLFMQNRIEFKNPYIVSDEFGMMRTVDEQNFESMGQASGFRTAEAGIEFKQLMQYQRKTEHNNTFVRIMTNARLLATAIRNTEGRKNIILITSGLYHWLNTEIPKDRMTSRREYSISVNTEVRNVIENLYESFNAFNISLYVLDVGRVQVMDTQRNLPEMEEFGDKMNFDLDVARTSALIDVAETTGGKFMKTSGGQPDKIAENLSLLKYESSFYYNLSYSPKEKQEPGEYYPVKIEVTRPDVTLKYRTGVTFPKTYEQMSDSEKEIYITEAVISNIPYNDLTLYSDVRFVPGKGDDVLTLFSLEVPFEDIFRGVSDRKNAELLMSALVYTPSGLLFKEFHKKVKVNVKENYRLNEKNALRYFQFLLLPHGKYNIRFFAGDKRTGRLVSDIVPINVPDYRNSPGAIGSIFESADNQQVLAVSDYNSLPGMQKTKINSENPLYLNGDILIHSFTRKSNSKEMRKIFTVVRGMSEQEILKGALNLRLITYDSTGDISSKNPVKYKIERVVKHKNGTIGVLLALDYGYLTRGKYAFEIDARDSKGFKHQSVHHFELNPNQWRIVADDAS